MAQPWALTATCLCCLGAAVAAGSDGPASLSASWLAVAFVPYALLATVRAHELQTRHLWWWASVTGLVLCAAPSVLSDDVYRYLWDGKVLLSGRNPYAQAPDDPAVAALRDGYWHAINHRSIATIYPPLAQAWFALASAVWHDPRSLKVLALLAHLATGWFVARLAAQSTDEAPFAQHASGLYLLNPLALGESALSGHVDAAAAMALCAGVLALGRDRPGRASLWLAASSGFKLIGLLVAPLAGRGRRVWALVAVAAALLPMGPPLLSAPPQVGGLGHYARRWQGNNGAFPFIVDGVALWLRGHAQGEYLERDHIHLESLEPWLRRVAGTPLDPWTATVAEKKEIPDRADFHIPYLASQLARAIVGLAVVALALGLTLARVPALTGARWLVLCTLLLAPQLHPWYLLWLLPLECASGKLAGLIWSATGLIAYAPLDLWQQARIWQESDLARLFEFGPVLLVLLLEPWLLMNGRAAPTPTSAP